MCLKNAFRKMCITICRRFCSNKGVVASYGKQILAKYIAKWGVQIMGMIFQTGPTPRYDIPPHNSASDLSLPASLHP